MRLICPNCDAQYDVPDDVIPAAGRDVQCSNCSTTWFFSPAAQEARELEEATAGVSASVPPPSEPPAPPTRRKLDPAIADVLREEAEFATRERAKSTVRNPIETQPDLGLDETDYRDEAAQRAEEARVRMARMRGEQLEKQQPPAEHLAADAAAAAVVAENTRRGLLPDVEEINSTLRADQDRSPPQDIEAAHRDAPKRRKGRFALGFWIVLLLAVLAVAAYIYAPQISEQVPQVADVMGQYVSLVDEARAWLDAQILAILAALDGMASEASPPSDG